MTRSEALAVVHASRGRVLALRFRKRGDGTLRTMNCRVGVRSHLKGEPVRDWDGTPTTTVYDSRTNLIRVFDMVAKGYRSVPLEGLTEIKVNGEWKEVTDG